MSRWPEWASFSVALIALAQPWVLFFWKKYFRKSKIEFHETAKLEIGFSNLGPAIGIIGTYRAIYGDVFVKSVEATIIKNKNKSQYDFTWLAFRSIILNVANLAPLHIELPSGFLVRQDKPVTLNILLNDKSTYQEITDTMNTHLGKFLDFERVHFKDYPGYEDADDPRTLIPLTQKKEFTDRFSNDGLGVDAYSKIDRCFYWDPGEYCLRLKVFSSDPDVVFEKMFRFVISEEDSRAIKLNVVRISNIHLDSFLGKDEPSWKFIYCDYLS